MTPLPAASVLEEWPVAILAGGTATRLRPITETIPKALLNVAGEPFLAHQLRLVRAQGFRDVVLCVGYRGEMIQDAIGAGDRFGLRVEYSFDGERLLGTGGALRRALPHLGEQFLVLYGDSYLPTDYAAIVGAFIASGKHALMTVFRNEGRWDTSNVWFDAGEIRSYEKVNRTAEMRYIDYGLGILRSDALRAWPADEAFDLAEVYKQLLAARQLAGYEVTERFYEIGSPAGLTELDTFFRERSNPCQV
jgi:NDP-sugar pyrophosphorylase family protein